ncbi:MULTISPECIES: DUF3108 domain-containing protein [Marinobacter]|uniref:DUF3108 domain-containing protein n=1 Tax=Marinobacter profundi TaxID=2666256 RepID=A0A2G1UQ77_9GAMM|nr:MULTISPECIES: DUF3108 domain-containing protein [Marinobacter]MBD3657451.1 DUF3108 domain-containing protein [Marinobacter sp.]PHQ16638.1 hypothetical protein CLH61_01265 [Marinobacter profundi]
MQPRTVPRILTCLAAGFLLGLLLVPVSATAVESANPAQPPVNGEQDTASPAASTPDPVPLTPLRASYSASFDKGISLSGSATRTLSARNDGTWFYEFQVTSFLADINESLVLRWENGQVIPLTYRYDLSGFFVPTRKRALDFDWDEGVVTGYFRDKKVRIELKEGALDPLGFQLQLHQDIKAGKTEMHYSVIDRNGYDEDRFAIIGEEQLETASGRIRTVKAEKVRDAGSKRETLMWFAPNQAYLLMRLVQLEPDGTRYEINIDDAEIRR